MERGGGVVSLRTVKMCPPPPNILGTPLRKTITDFVFPDPSFKKERGNCHFASVVNCLGYWYEFRYRYQLSVPVLAEPYRYDFIKVRLRTFQMTAPALSLKRP